MPDNQIMHLSDLKTLTPQKRLEYYVAMDDFETLLFRHIAQGGLLTELASTWDVYFCDLYNHITSDPRLKELFERASKARIEFFIDDLKKQLKAISTLDIRQIYDKDGCIKPVEEWPEALGLTVQSIEVNELWEGKGNKRTQVGLTKKIKFWDKTKSIEMLGKTLSMFVDRHEVTVSSLEDLIKKSYIDVDADKS